MVERGTRPVDRGVANGAVLREPCGDVIGNVAPERGCALPCSDVTAVAGCGIEQIIVAHVAGNAGRRRRGNVHSRQGKPRGAMVKSRRGPTYCVMAYRTIRRRKLRTRRRVRRIICLVPGRQMAA